MDRAGNQLAISGFAGLALHGGWRYLAQRLASQAVTELMTTHSAKLLVPLLGDPLLGFSVQKILLIGGGLLLIEWYPLLWQCTVVAGHVLFHLILSLLWLIEWLLICLVALFGYLGGWSGQALLPYSRTECRALTCNRLPWWQRHGSLFRLALFP